MSIFPRSLSSILIVVVFIVLAILASLAYSSDSDPSTELEANPYYQKTQSFIGKAIIVAKNLSNINSTKNSSITSRVSTAFIEDNLADTLEEPSESSFSDLYSKTKDDVQNKLSAETISDLKPNLEKIVSFEKTERGLEIILRIKNEEEKKIVLPFKF